MSRRSTISTAYRNALRALLTPAEHRIFARLTTPDKIQTFIDRIPINFETGGDTHMSPRRVLQERRAHCTEGAMLAAAALAYHGEPPWLMDLRALPADQDHVVALFSAGGRWGAISKTNHPVLRWRDPVYASPRELAMSFAHEYYLRDGRKSLVAYSRPFRLTRYAPARWVTAAEELDWLIAALDDSLHCDIAPQAILRKRRRVSALERHAVETVEWLDPRRAARGRLGAQRWQPRRPRGQ